MAPDPSVPDTSWSSVKLSIAVSLIQLAVALGAVEALLLWRPGYRFLAPRLVQRRGSEAGVPWPPPLGWLKAAWHDRRSPGSLEPDGTVLVRFCELGFKFCLFGTMLDVVLLPMYYTGHGNAKGFNCLSLSNLTLGGSNRFWGVVVAAYVLTATFAHFVITEWHSFVHLRRQHFCSAARGECSFEAAQVQRSLMVEAIPPESRSQQAVENFFSGLFGDGSVHSCVLQTDTTAAYRLQVLHQNSRRFCVCCCPSGVQPDPSVMRTVGALRQDMARELVAGPQRYQGTQGSQLLGLVQHSGLAVVQAVQELTVGRSASSTAFVTLRSAAHCAEAKQVLLTHAAGWKVVEAPETRDLIWPNVSIPFGQIHSRNRLAVTACFVCFVFWSVPVGLIQTWANIATLQKWWPSIGNLQDWSPLAFSLLTSWLPVLALMGLQAALPYLFEASAAGFEGHKAKSTVQRIVLNRCFAYQLASVYVINMSGSWLVAMQDIFDSPKNVLSLLAGSLPQVAVYFFSLVMARVGISLPLLLLRPWAWGSLPLAARSRDSPVAAGLEAPEPPPPVRCALGSQAADTALVLVIGLTYSFIAPAILPACALYFGLASLVYRWLFANVYEPEFDGGGVIWFDLFNSVLLGLLLGTLSLLGLALAYADSAQFLALVPLPLLVGMLGCHCWYSIGFQSKHVALEDAVHVDGAEDPTPGFCCDLYRDPILVVARGTVAADTEGEQ